MEFSIDVSVAKPAPKRRSGHRHYQGKRRDIAQFVRRMGRDIGDAVVTDKRKSASHRSKIKKSKAHRSTRTAERTIIGRFFSPGSPVSATDQWGIQEALGSAA